MSRRYVLDSSAVLAAVNEEQGGKAVEAVMREAAISAVNLTEVASRLLDRGVPDAGVKALLRSLRFDIHAFDDSQAWEAAALRPLTRKLGLSLGDRACIALARKLSLPVLTGDRAWADLDLGVEVELIR